MSLFKKKVGHRSKPDRRAVWSQVAQRADGELRQGKRPAEDRVIVTHGPWAVHLDTYVQQEGQVAVTYTRVRAYFLGWRQLKVLVRRRNLFDGLVEAVGFGSRLPLGRALTERYVVKGTPRPRIPSFFAGSHLSDAIMAVPSLRLEVKRAERKSRRKFGESAGVVVCLAPGVILEVERLIGMVEVVKEALDGLQRIGEAGEDPLGGGT